MSLFLSSSLLRPVLEPSTYTMTPTERRASGWLASIFALRMFGLFLILPVFAIYGRDLFGGKEPYLIGLAISIYGLTQAFLQIPFGAASDRFGRKPVIVLGLLLFAIGGVVAALSTHISGVILGRALQGAGAISAAVSAYIADSTRDEVRTKAMAMVGGTIGISFALSMIIAPPLAAWIGLSGLFWLTAVLACVGIVVLIWLIPPAPTKMEQPEMIRHGDVLFNPHLFRLNFGVFVLHATMTALFVIIPTRLIAIGGLPSPEHWKVYLPVLGLSFILIIPPMLAAERHGKLRTVFLAAITLLLFSLLLAPWLTQQTRWGLALFLFLFFIAFNLLEAMQPSLVSRLVPSRLKGFAMGVYNTTQSIGLALGGILAGVLAKRLSDNVVFMACAVLAALWLTVAWNMQATIKKQGV